MSFSKKIMIGAVTAFLGIAVNASTAAVFFTFHKEYADRDRNANAQFNTGFNFSAGDGTVRNTKSAMTYFQRAANAGNEMAQVYLAMDFERKNNLRQAAVWYKKAAAKDQEVALYKLGEFSEFGKGGEKQDWKKAAEYYKKSADKGYAPAQYKYGVMCAMGKGVAQSWKEAAVWYKKAAQPAKNTYPPDAMAQCNLAWCYAKGLGVAQSWKEAAKWYLASAESGVAEAQFQLAECYAKGQGVEANKDWAVYWYRKAASNGIAKAREALKAYGLN